MLIIPNYLTATDTLNLTRKPYRESKVDILALSCASYRLRQGKDGQTYGLVSSVLLEEVTSADAVMAADIRRDYIQKIMMWKLKDTNFTKFRAALSKFLLTDGLSFGSDEENWEGMVYRLPEFYSYDCQLENIKNRYQYHNQKPQSFWNNKKEIKKLTPIICLARNSRHKGNMDYFLETIELDQVARITVYRSNPLLQLWDNIFSLRAELSIEGVFNYRNIDDLSHFEISKWNVVNINLT
jgi:hypothetical protein